MIRSLARLILGAALYGASAGMLYGPRQMARNLVKLPLLLVGTAIVCALAYHLAARWLTDRLAFREVQALVGRLYRDAAVLLASLATVNVLLALVLVPPEGRAALHDYPLFLGLNIAFVALCGGVALVAQARALLAKVARWRAAVILGAWLSLSLAVGGQWAFYLRPIFGIAAIERPDAPFCEGDRPDFRGATNFFEVVAHLLSPPDQRL